MDPTFSNYTPEQKAALFAPKPTLGMLGNMYASEGEALLANYNLQGAGGYGGNVPEPPPIQTRQQIADNNLARISGLPSTMMPSGPSGYSPPASRISPAPRVWQGAMHTSEATNSGSSPGNLSLPTNAPLIPAAAYNIAAVVQALANLQICVYDSAGVMHRGSIVIAGNQAILSVHL